MQGRQRASGFLESELAALNERLEEEKPKESTDSESPHVVQAEAPKFDRTDGGRSVQTRAVIVDGTFRPRIDAVTATPSASIGKAMQTTNGTLLHKRHISAHPGSIAVQTAVAGNSADRSDRTLLHAASGLGFERLTLRDRRRYTFGSAPVSRESSPLRPEPLATAEPRTICSAPSSRSRTPLRCDSALLASFGKQVVMGTSAGCPVVCECVRVHVRVRVRVRVRVCV